MGPLDEFPDDGGAETVFRDVIFLALAGFVAVVLLLLPHLNPPRKAEEGNPSPGNVIVELLWPKEVEADVDLWVQAPGDRPVGYSNKGGVVFNLLRDDLGVQSDLTDLNYEVSYSRGIPAGEYTVNVHLYRDAAGEFPLPVTIAVSVKSRAGDAAKRILATELSLKRTGEEITAFRFRLDEKGALIAGSVHDTPRALRNGKRS